MKIHIVFREADGVRRWATACGRAVDGFPRPRAYTVSLDDYDNVDLCSDAVRRVLSDERLCAVCERALQARVPRPPGRPPRGAERAPTDRGG